MSLLNIPLFPFAKGEKERERKKEKESEKGKRKRNSNFLQVPNKYYLRCLIRDHFKYNEDLVSPSSSSSLLKSLPLLSSLSLFRVYSIVCPLELSLNEETEEPTKDSNEKKVTEEKEKRNGREIKGRECFKLIKKGKLTH